LVSEKKMIPFKTWQSTFNLSTSQSFTNGNCWGKQWKKSTIWNKRNGVKKKKWMLICLFRLILKMTSLVISMMVMLGSGMVYISASNELRMLMEISFWIQLWNMKKEPRFLSCHLLQNLFHQKILGKRIKCLLELSKIGNKMKYQNGGIKENGVWKGKEMVKVWK
jgi:hypothetical protein